MSSGADDDSPLHAFRFLSGRQISELTKLTSRQALPASAIPQDRPLLGKEEDDALLYMFVSHRWESKRDPDTSGMQLRTLKGLLRLVEELLLWTVATKATTTATTPTFSWPRTLEELVEGMPQAASLVARINHGHPRFSEMCQNPLDHIWLWYDCACLPQKYPLRRTADEEKEMRLALSQLDELVSQCELVCLRTPDDDYEHRAWCSFEHLQKSLNDFEGDLSIDCHKFEQDTLVDWFVTENGPDPIDSSVFTRLQGLLSQPVISQSITQGVQSILDIGHDFQNRIQQFTSTVESSRNATLQRIQRKWDGVHDSASTEEKPPDLCQARYEMRRTRTVAPPPPPLQQALEQMARELFAAFFVASCRDASSWAEQVVPVPANLNACIPHVGIQCGLHHHGTNTTTNTETTTQEYNTFQECVQSCWNNDLQFDYLDREGLCCPKGHRMRPRLALFPLKCDSKTCPRQIVEMGQAHASCSSCNYDLCMDCATTTTKGAAPHSDVDSTSQAALELVLEVCSARFPQTLAEKSNDDQLCERRVTVDLYELSHTCLTSFDQRCTNEGDLAFVGLLALRNFLIQRQKMPRRPGLHLYAGALNYLRPLVETAVQRLSAALASDEDMSSLPVTAVLRVPRWVLLDLANTLTFVDISLLHEDPLTFGDKAEQYLMDHPQALSFSMDTDEVSTPLRRGECFLDDNCTCCWYPCKHELERQMALSSFSRGDDVLDSWTTSELPTTLALFGSVVVDDSSIFLLGGATGEEDPELKVFATCISNVVVASLSKQSNELTWTNVPNLSHPRCSHASCVLRDSSGRARTIVVSGGAQPPTKLSSVELLSLESIDEGWVAGPPLPRARKSHHMVGLDGCLFVFGGQTDVAQHNRDCDIFCLARNCWANGPRFPQACRGGDMIVIREHFVAIFGGMVGNSQQHLSWVLHLKPWVDWCSAGCLPDHRPPSTWIRGPNLPTAMAAPNVCYAASSETGRSDDWIISTGSLETSNTCYGIQFDASQVTRNPSFWSNLRWQRLGPVPDVSAMGKTIVANGSLYMIGGFRAITQRLSSTIHTRKLNPSHRLPLPTAFEITTSALLGDITQHYRIALNNHYPVGRLGFPLPENQLFPGDGTRVLRLLPSGDVLRH